MTRAMRGIHLFNKNNKTNNINNTNWHNKQILNYHLFLSLSITFLRNQIENPNLQQTPFPPKLFWTKSNKMQVMVTIKIQNQNPNQSL